MYSRGCMVKRDRPMRRFRSGTFISAGMADVTLAAASSSWAPLVSSLRSDPRPDRPSYQRLKKAVRVDRRLHI